MKRLIKRIRQLVWGLLGLMLVNSTQGALPPDWARVQQFTVAAPGLLRLNLPTDTLDAARPALEDLRLYDEAGNELPFLAQSPAPEPRTERAARSFQAQLNTDATVLTIATGSPQPLAAVVLQTPALDFIKSVLIESSADGHNWQPLAKNLPVFRQPNGAEQLRVPFPPGRWAWLRVTIDDRRAQPIPITGVNLVPAATQSAPGETVAVTIVERHESPGESRLTLNLGAANLKLTQLELETSEPLFARQITLAEPELIEESIRERTIAAGSVFRVALEGTLVSTNLQLSVTQPVRSRELLLVLKNQDSPPIPITAVRAERRPVQLVFLARTNGIHRLLSGNPRCVAPRYDLAALGTNFANLTVADISVSALAANPDFRPGDILPASQAQGAPLDVTPWGYLRSVQITNRGIQRLELDLVALAHSQSELADLRVLNAAGQMPYLIERTSISRTMTLNVVPTNHPTDKTVSRWLIQLPTAGVPLTHLHCATSTVLFQRELSLFEELTDERGEHYRRGLGNVTWVSTPDHPRGEFSISLTERPQTDRLILETHNGDNPPVQLEKFQGVYPVSRLLFNVTTTDGVTLYYGNLEVHAPRYDLGLISTRVLAAPKMTATLGAEIRGKNAPGGRSLPLGTGGLVFWGILAVVVVTLLVVIARLLPKPTQS